MSGKLTLDHKNADVVFIDHAVARFSNCFILEHIASITLHPTNSQDKIKPQVN